MREVRIGRRFVGPGHPVFIIAEAGVNHNGDLEMAKRLIEVAAESGADAVKFQTFAAEKLVSADAPKAEYQKRTTGEDESQFNMLKRLELSASDYKELVRHANQCGITFLSTPFDETSADFLVELEVPALKVGSGDLTNLPLLRHMAAKGLPMLISTGMGTLGEIEEALAAVMAAGNDQVLLYHCVSSYPAPVEETNLRALNTMMQAFPFPIGYSDHTPGIAVPVAAVALGAVSIEKHFTLDRSLPGPDQETSLEPGELAAMVKSIRQVEAALGDGYKRPTLAEANVARVARRSLVAARDIPSGAVLTADMLAIRRPGTGIPPKHLELVQGRTTRRELRKGQVITWDLLV